MLATSLGLAIEQLGNKTLRELHKADDHGSQGCAGPASKLRAQYDAAI
jgi:hypothetical protein